MSIHCCDILDADELEALAPQWWELWQRSPTATPFQTPAWLVSWWRAFAPGRLHAVAAWQGRSLVGLAPYYLDGRRLLPIGISVSDYLDVLLDPECAEAAGEALVEHVGRSGAWQAWELCEAPPLSWALRLHRPAGCTEDRQRQSLCLVMPLPKSAGGIREAIPATTRRKIAQAENRAARRGEVRLERLDGQETGEAFELLIRLHEACWRNRDAPGVLTDPRVRQLHREALGPLAARDLVRFHAARIGGQVASIYYGFHHGGQAYGYLTGFDPEFAFESPGMLLLAHVLEESVREGAREFHFLRGDEAYKRAWNPVERWNERRVFERPEGGGNGNRAEA